MRIFVAVTDNDWYRFLRDRPYLEEVNFWQPSGRTRFRALSDGGMFLFKLHAPENFIAGGGFFAHFSFLPHRTAWEFFGEANGVESLDAMRRRLEKYRREAISPFSDVQIGCIMLSRPFFFPYRDWIEVPRSFSRNIVRGKGYDTTEDAGRLLLEQVQQRLRGDEIAEPQPPPSLWGDPIPIRPRLGQGTFRSVITDIYDRRCSISGERALPVLDAAHIRPVSFGGQHEVPNGLLLRSDIHRLYDRGYLTVTPEQKILVSPRLKSDFDNGEPYYPFHGRQLTPPARREQHPSREALEWHADTKFLR